MGTPLFPLGQCVITANAKDKLHPEDIPPCLARHAAGDWGDLCDDDKHENDLSVQQGFRILSAYTDRSCTKFWIITEASREPSNVKLHISDVMWRTF